MTKDETKEILKKIDVTYQTNYMRNEMYVVEWYKELKNFDFEDVYTRLEEHMRSNFSNSVPKLYFLTKGLKTPEEKERMSNLLEYCPLCKAKVKLENFDEHYENCMDIDYIRKNVKKYLDQEIILSDYYSMSREDIKKRVDKIMKIVYQKTDNQFEKNCLRKYFKTKEEMI